MSHHPAQKCSKKIHCEKYIQHIGGPNEFGLLLMFRPYDIKHLNSKVVVFLKL